MHATRRTRRAALLAGVALLVVCAPSAWALFGPSKPRDRVPQAKGWSFQVQRVVRVDLTTTTTGVPPTRTYYETDVTFDDLVQQVDSKGLPLVYQRKISKAVTKTLNMLTGKIDERRMCEPGYVIVFDERKDGTGTTDADGNQPDAVLSSTVGGMLALPLWPDLNLTKGRKWSYKGQQVTDRLGTAGITGGQLDLEVTAVRVDEQSGLTLALIEGPLKSTLVSQNSKMSYDAKVQIVLPLEVGVPLRSIIAGKVQQSMQFNPGTGQIITTTVSGTITLAQGAVPQASVLKSLRDRKVKALAKALAARKRQEELRKKKLTEKVKSDGLFSALGPLNLQPTPTTRPAREDEGQPLDVLPTPATQPPPRHRAPANPLGRDASRNANGEGGDLTGGS